MTPSTPPRDGQKHGFSEHLAHQLGARCSEGKANGHLALTAGGLGEEQVGDVGSGDAEDQSTTTLSAPRKSRTVELSLMWQRAGLLEGEAVVLVGCGISFGEIRRERAQLGCNLGAGDAGLHARDDSEPVEVARGADGNIDGQLFDIAERHPELRSEDEVDAAKGAAGRRRRR